MPRGCQIQLEYRAAFHISNGGFAGTADPHGKINACHSVLRCRQIQCRLQCTTKGLRTEDISLFLFPSFTASTTSGHPDVAIIQGGGGGGALGSSCPASLTWACGWYGQSVTKTRCRLGYCCVGGAGAATQKQLFFSHQHYTGWVAGDKVIPLWGPWKGVSKDALRVWLRVVDSVYALVINHTEVGEKAAVWGMGYSTVPCPS